MEKEYDNNLGFESKVKEKKDELVLLNNQIYSNRTILQLQPLIGPTLISPFQEGITEQDIIKVNQLVDKINKMEEEEENEEEEEVEKYTKIVKTVLVIKIIVITIVATVKVVLVVVGVV
jgi:hypothetical protein